MSTCPKVDNGVPIRNKKFHTLRDAQWLSSGIFYFFLVSSFFFHRAMAADVTIIADWTGSTTEPSVQIYDENNTVPVTPVFDRNTAGFPEVSYTLADNTNYNIRMLDAGGNGWRNGSTITLSIDGVELTTQSGPAGDSRSVLFNTGGAGVAATLNPLTYIGPTEYSASLNAPLPMMQGTLENLTDAQGLSTVENHTNLNHLFVPDPTGVADIRFSFANTQDISAIHLWNSNVATFYTSSASFRFFNSGGTLLGTHEINPLPLGNASGLPYTENIPLVTGVAYVDVLMTAAGDGVDLLNLGFSRPTENQNDSAPPSPSLDIMSCQAILPLDGGPDGLEDKSFPRGYWATSYYEGTDTVRGSYNSQNTLNGTGFPGEMLFKGEAFWGSDGESSLTLSSQGSDPNGRWSRLETPTSPTLPHPSYSGETWKSSGNPFYQIDMRQKMTYRGELKFGYGDQDYLDDVLEVFVNGSRRYVFFPNDPTNATPRPGAGTGVTLKLEAGDDVLIRFMNWGDMGGYHLEVSSPMPDCSDSPEDGTINPSENVNNYGIAHHAVFSDIRMGEAVDGENTSVSSANADGDGADDDGVTFTPMIPGFRSTITVNVSGDDGFLQAWIDWNGDGDYSDQNEQIATDIQDGGANDIDGKTGVIAFEAVVPNAITQEPTYVRLRWSTTAGLLSTAGSWTWSLLPMARWKANASSRKHC